jgi:eukaryotic-like serine/threonine-protein kinase
MSAKKRKSSKPQTKDYVVEEQLYRRPTTELYLARGIDSEATVFLQVLQASGEEETELVGRFQRRMEIVSQLVHPAIAPVLGMGMTAEQRPYAAIKHVAGVPLSEKLAEWRQEGAAYPVTDTLLLVRPLVEALTIAHPAGIIHHDLRPENIIIQPDNTPLLIDLGVPIISVPAEEAAVLPPDKMLDYASPEQLEGKALSGRSNLYSLGILLYELLAGHRPELPVSEWDIFERRALPQETPLDEARGDLTPATYELVKNCLWRQEWNRFETADEMLLAIDKAIAAEQAAASAPPPAELPERRWLYIAIAIGAVLLLLLAAFLLLRSRGDVAPQATLVLLLYSLPPSHWSTGW